MELGTADDKLKEGVKPEKNDHSDLKVEGQDGSEVPLSIKRHVPLSALIEAQGRDSSEVLLSIKRHVPLSTLIEAHCERQGCQ